MEKGNVGDFQKILTDACRNFGELSARNLSGLFGQEVTMSEVSTMNDGIHTGNHVLVSILFTGSVYGEYVMALEEKLIADLMGRPLPTSPVESEAWRSEITDTFRELLNVIAGEAIVALGKSFDKLTITAPKVHFGRVTYPRVRTARALLKTPVGDVECFLLVDRMKLDLAASYRDTLSSLTVAHRELQSAMDRLKDQQTLIVQSEKMAALGTMAAGVAHEINTPLATISLAAEQIRELASPDGAQSLMRMISVIEKTVGHIAQVIAGLRMYARGRDGDPFTMISVREIMDTTIVLCSSYLKGRGVDLKVDDIPRDLMCMCRGPQISQVLMNLIKNACDALENTSQKWIRVEFREMEERFVFRVIDAGVGVPADVREKIFDPFFTTKEIGKGTGLGLSIAKGIVNDHQGTLEIDTASQNTCFVLSLPKTRSEELRPTA